MRVLIIKPTPIYHTGIAEVSDIEGKYLIENGIAVKDNKKAMNRQTKENKQALKRETK